MVLLERDEGHTACKAGAPRQRTATRLAAAGSGFALEEPDQPAQAGRTSYGSASL